METIESSPEPLSIHSRYSVWRRCRRVPLGLAALQAD